MNESSFVSGEAKIYRLHLLYRLYYFAIGVAALVGAVKVYQAVMVDYHFLIFSVVLALLGVFSIYSPLVMAVTVDQNSVTIRGVFSKKSLQRSSIIAIETKHTGKGSLLILQGDIDKKERLEIPAIFAFDDDWNNWLNTYRDFSDDKPISLF